MTSRDELRGWDLNKEGKGKGGVARSSFFCVDSTVYSMLPTNVYTITGCLRHLDPGLHPPTCLLNACAWYCRIRYAWHFVLLLRVHAFTPLSSTPDPTIGLLLTPIAGVGAWCR